MCTWRSTISHNIIIGIVIRNKSNSLIELHTIYESHLRDGPAADIIGCEIGNNFNGMYLDGQRTCQIQMKVPDNMGTMQPPVLVHYELYNFYQNYRKYQNSFDAKQLFGLPPYVSPNPDENPCNPLLKIGNVTINPCGLIANTLFNDVITLESIVGPDGEVIDAPLVESGIAWASDLEWKYRQPQGFRSEQCASCDDCDCAQVDANGKKLWSCKQSYNDTDGNCFRYYYPDDDTTLYLYESFPMVVSPLDGVTNEHFVVWMRIAALSHFRKLYGYIDVPIPAGSTLTFNVMANFAVQRNEGAKALVVSNTYAFGGKNNALGTFFVAVGVVAVVIGLLFLFKEMTNPRKLGDRAYLKHKSE